MAHQPINGNGSPDPAAAAVMEIESGASLTVNSGKTFNVGYYSILSGGNMTVNGTVNINTDLDVQTGSTLNINSGGRKVGP